MNREDFETTVNKYVNKFVTGEVKSHSQLFVYCNKDPVMFGCVMEKIVALDKDGVTRRLSERTDASTTSASGQADSEEPPKIQGVRTRSRAARTIEQGLCEIQPRKRVSRKIRFPSDGLIKGQEVVSRHRCERYLEQGIRCLCFVWQQTQRLLTSVGNGTAQLCAYTWESLRDRQRLGW